MILARPITGERTIFWSRQNLPHLEKGIWQDSWLDDVDLLYLDGHEPALSLVAAIKAKNRNIPVVFDAGSVREASRELVALCTDVISSSTFATDLTEIDDCALALKKIRSMGPSRVAMTFGREGVVALDHNLFSVPSFKINAVDTTGAGDVFHAGYAYSMACGGGFRSNLVFAAAVSAIKCEHWGGRGGLPSLKQAQHMVKTGEINTLGPKCRI